jgi:hypothetical protein
LGQRLACSAGVPPAVQWRWQEDQPSARTAGLPRVTHLPFGRHYQRPNWYEPAGSRRYKQRRWLVGPAPLLAVMLADGFNRVGDDAAARRGDFDALALGLAQQRLAHRRLIGNLAVGNI